VKAVEAGRGQACKEARMHYFAPERPKNAKGMPFLIRDDGSRAGYREGIHLPTICVEPLADVGKYVLHFYLPNGDASFSYNEITWDQPLDDFFKEFREDPEACLMRHFQYKWVERPDLVFRYGKDRLVPQAQEAKPKKRETTLADLFGP
jgi:hypothetical protein